jgi:hypothetical protein
VAPTSGEFEHAAGRSLFALEADRIGWLSLASRELWRHLPAWMFFFIGCSALYVELSNLTPARPELAPTVLFPIAVFCLYYVARALRAPDVHRRRGMLTLTLGLAFGIPTLEVTHHASWPIGADALRILCEVAAVSAAATLAIHAWRRSRTVALLCFGVAAAYGVLLESVGVALGFWTVNAGSVAWPLPAPWVTICGWCVVFYLSFAAVRGLRAWVPSLRRAPRVSAVVATGVALLLMLQLDPAASAVGLWAWSPTLPALSHGVPFAALVAWAAALLPFAFYIYRFQQHAGLTDRSQWTSEQLRLALGSLPAILTVAAAFFLLTLALAEGTKGPSYELLYGATDRLLAWL